jgi:membrane protein YqaA with SNARE-associated domain
MNGVGMLVSCFLLSIVSALVPWVNGEVMVLSFSALAPSPVHLAGLALLASAGQMIGKCILYWTGRGALSMKKGRVAQALNSWKGRLERSSKKTMGLVFLSAIFGIPPFYIISILSGAVGLRFSQFIAIGACGRLLHFGVLILIPQFGIRLYHIIVNH